VTWRGRVSVRGDAGDWRLLDVYDDGWCEAPAPVRTAEETRRRLRELLAWMGALVLLFGAAAVSAVLLSDALWISFVLLAASGAVLVAAALRAAVARSRSRAPDFDTAAAQAAAVDGTRRVAVADVRSVQLQRAGHEDVVTVTVRRGAPLVYRSPDRTLGRLFQRWSPAPPRT
jgi:membrane protein implicated in regulation of membrane protease activity